MMGRGMEHWHPEPAVLLPARRRPGARHGTLLPHHAGQPAWARRGACMAMAVDRLAGAADHGRRPAARHALRRSARPPRSRRCSNSPPGARYARHELGRVSAFAFRRSSCTARWLAPPARSRHVRRPGRAEPGWCRLGTRRRPTRRRTAPINWPYAAPDRANYRMLGVADLARSLNTGRPRAPPAGWPCTCWRSPKRSCRPAPETRR